MTFECIESYQLSPSPYGGHVRKVYEATRQFEVDGQMRSAAASYYYYLESDDFLAWVRIASDLLVHFYAGAGLTVHTLDASGNLSHVRMGDPLDATCHIPQHWIPAGVWFAAEVECDNAFAFVGCTVTPSVSEPDCELGQVDQLTAHFQVHEAILRRLSR